jgi:hypothetical protein
VSQKTNSPNDKNCSRTDLLCDVKVLHQQLVAETVPAVPLSVKADWQQENNKRISKLIVHTCFQPKMSERTISRKQISMTMASFASASVMPGIHVCMSVKNKHKENKANPSADRWAQRPGRLARRENAARENRAWSKVRVPTPCRQTATRKRRPLAAHT